MKRLLLAMLLAGCARSPLDDRLYAPPPRAERVDAPRDAAVGLPSPAGADDYVAVMLRRNPRLNHARFAAARMRQRVPQATGLDDPMLMVSPIGEMAETAEGAVGTMTSVSQTLPTPGKLAARGQMAAHEAEAMRQEYEALRLTLIAQTRRAYWHYDYAVRAAAIYDEQAALLTPRRAAAAARYETGGGSQQDLLDAAIALGELKVERLAIVQQRDGAAARLNRLLSRPAEAPLPPLKDAAEPVIPDAPPAPVADHPRLEQARQLAAAYRAQWKLARLNRWPDLNVGVNYNTVDGDGAAMSATGKDQWWLNFGVNLPIWTEKRDAAEREALHGLAESAAELTSRTNDLAFEAHDALLRVRQQQQAIALLRDDILPQAQRRAAADQAAYESGNLSYGDVVESTRKVLSVRLLSQQAVTQLHQDWADLQEAIGRDWAGEGGEPHEPR